MNNPELFNESNSATYCPEDDKIRLYVGRVPRDEYEALRAEGWTSTPKQECDFVAVWTPAREDTAESYAGIVEDEDAGPDERAADRAERFGGYLDKRLDEATGHADRFDAGPSAHGYQSKARAVRAADRHDRTGTRAVNAWDKAEYWQHRTAGVIDHALHLQSPGVRMGRIKTIEAELRQALKNLAERREDYRRAVMVAADPAGFVTSTMARAPGRYDDENDAARNIAETLFGWWDAKHPRNPDAPAARAWSLMDPRTPDPLTLAEVCALWLASHREPPSDEEGTRTILHLRLRLAYENQMIEAQGGRAAFVEMEIGGFIGGHQIHKVNKSPATGRVVSVAVKVKTNGCNRWGREEPGTPEFRMETVNIERASVSSYRAPTDAEREAFHGAKKAAKAAAPKSTAPPLVNPTIEDAQRLQAVFNASTVARWEREHGRKVTDTLASYYTPPKAAEVWEMTQAQYFEASKGSYAKFETREILQGGAVASKSWNAKHAAPVVVKVRVGGYEPYRVVFITDKPSKALPAAVWVEYVAPIVEGDKVEA